MNHDSVFQELSKYLPFIVGNIVKMATSDAEDIANEVTSRNVCDFILKTAILTLNKV